MNRTALLLMILAVGGLCACRQQPPERKYIAVAVTAREIDVETGMVTVEWKDPHTNQATHRSGRVTIDTEIFINGISASLEDVRAGDHGTVIVYPIVTSGQEEWIVTRVSVEREDSFMLTKPAPATD